MSAWMCSDGHINLLVLAAATYGCYLSRVTIGGPGVGAEQVKNGHEQAAGELLHQANVDSLVARYGDTASDLYGVYGGYRHAELLKGHLDDPIVVLKACACFDYQSSETGDYYQSPAAELVRQIRSVAISKLPGYDLAPWGIDDPPLPKRTRAKKSPWNLADFQGTFDCERCGAKLTSAELTQLKKKDGRLCTGCKST